MKGKRLAHILIVDDDPGDVLLMKEGLEDTGIVHRIDVAEDGPTALTFLRDQDRPDLILLDLNMPGMNGLEVLAEVRADVKFAKLPVIVFTTSDAERDIIESYGLGANCFITKPPELDEFMDAIHEVKAFWLELASLPRFE